jgi:hypothetical protein
MLVDAIPVIAGIKSSSAITSAAATIRNRPTAQNPMGRHTTNTHYAVQYRTPPAVNRAWICEKAATLPYRWAEDGLFSRGNP